MMVEFNWKQEGNKALIEFPKGEVYFIMPDKWKLSETHPDLLKLTEYLLFSPYYPIDLYNYKFTRKPGKKIGLAFSGGVDSTAAMQLLPENTELVYNQREGFENTAMKQDNALRMFKKMKRNVWEIKSNQEIVNELFGSKRGYSTDYCVGLGVILMADMLDLGYFATGQMMESTFIKSGTNFRSFEKTRFWNEMNRFFGNTGLTLLGPTFSCSEVVTNKIVEVGEFKGLAQSCVRGMGGKGCDLCYKCFRKNLIRGKIINANSWEIDYYLKKRPLKQGSSLIYAMNKLKLKIPQVEEYEGMKLEWVENYYSPALKLLPKEIRIIVKGNLDKYGIKPMTNEEMEEMKLFNIT